ncbi:MAG: cell division protein FtsA [Ignavibacterium sp.]|nr:cell division protein FtsA [Ignavibacterium sp.]
MTDKIIAGVDLGSSSIKIAISNLNQDGLFQVIAVAEEAAEGISKGVIINLEEAVSSLSRALEKAERMVGYNIDRCFVGISGTHIICQPSRGVVAVSNAKGEIKEEDVKRVLEAAQTVATPPNYEILHIVPLSYIVDSQPGIKDPLGMTGVRLEVEAQVVEGLSNQIKILSKVLSRTGVSCEDLVFSILAASEAVLERKEKELGVAVLNLGSTISSLAVFEEGDLLTTKILPIGSRHITGDIAIGLKVPVDVAELIKIYHGHALPEKFSKDEKINLAEFDEKEINSVSQKMVAEIIEARVEEIFKMVDKELIAIKKSKKLPAGLIITGGGAKLRGIEDLAKKVLKLPVNIGLPKNISLAIEKAEDPTYATAIGLTIWGKENSLMGGEKQVSSFDFLKNIFKKFLP